MKLPLAIRITCPGSQILQSAELKLLDGAFRAPERRRYFTNTLLLGESHLDDAALIFRKPVDQSKEASAVFNLLEA